MTKTMQIHKLSAVSLKSPTTSNQMFSHMQIQISNLPCYNQNRNSWKSQRVDHLPVRVSISVIFTQNELLLTIHVT